MSKELEKNELIAKWLSGDLTIEEKAKITRDYRLDDLETVLDDISSWKVKNFDTEAKLLELKQRKSASIPTTRIIPFQAMYRIAAVLFLGLSIFLFKYLDQQKTKVNTALGETIKHEFPDGSIAHLAPKSSIVYKVDAWTEERNVEMSGQVYFEVLKGKAFTVKSKTINVKVLGTRFEVSESDEEVKTICYEGTVSVSSSSGNDVILTKGSQVIILDNEFNTSKTDAISPTWLGDRLKFEEALLSEVLVEILKYYNIEMEIPKKYQSLRFSGVVAKTDLDKALMSIFVPLEINYRVENGWVVFD